MTRQHEGYEMGRDMGAKHIEPGHGIRQVVCPHKSVWVWDDAHGWAAAHTEPECDCPEPPPAVIRPCRRCGAMHVSRCACGD